ncbi:hypothetical protein CBL_08657 [Carabus blaptoides fortunei]
MDDAKPVPIATISGTQPTPESEMDALLLGRTGVSGAVFPYREFISHFLDPRDDGQQASRLCRFHSKESKEIGELGSILKEITTTREISQDSEFRQNNACLVAVTNVTSSTDDVIRGGHVTSRQQTVSYPAGFTLYQDLYQAAHGYNANVTHPRERQGNDQRRRAYFNKHDIGTRSLGLTDIPQLLSMSGCHEE